jgi:hypothetical protein
MKFLKGTVVKLYNRDQVRDCAKFLGQLVPIIIEIMMDNVDALWGDACFPVVAS